MRSYFALGCILALLTPVAASAAAYNDVTLNNGTLLSVNGITITVTGATLNQIVTNPTNFAVILAPSSTISVTAPNRNQLSISPAGSSLLKANQCDSSASSFTLTAGSSDATTTFTVTPSATLCTTSTSSGGGSAASGGGGNGPIIGLLGANTPSAVVPASVAASQLPAAGNTPDMTKSGARMTQPTHMPASSFTRNLKVGMLGGDVQALQIYLNTHGYVIAASGPGSPGHETKKFGLATQNALRKLQIRVGIRPASGYFGAATRAYINAHL